MYVIASSCKYLQCLNLSGCINITQTGLQQLVLGIPYIQEAVTYFGFRPKDGAMQQKLADQFKLLQIAASNKIKALFKGHVVL